MKTFSIISLGCSRNLVDSELIAGALKAAGLKARDPDSGADVCVINTCAFIESARRESVDAIMEASRLKERGKAGKLIVCGCLPQYSGGGLLKALPEADLVLGASDFPKIAKYLGLIAGKKRRSEVSPDPAYLYNESSPRSSLTPAHYAYVKVSEGCSNLCSYCIISRLRGRFRSRTIASVVSEVNKLSRGGKLKEIDLVGQDTTLFGIDRTGRVEFPELLRRLAALDNGVEWIRLLYTHPAHYTDELIETIRNTRKICRYLDLPIQHISDAILKRMNRRTTKRQIVSLVERLRKRIPGIALRTSIIVGFPAETDRQFKELVSFLRQTKFERLGAFKYCREPGTRAGRFEAQVSENVKAERYEELMKLQQKISLERNRSLVGRSLRVLVDEKEPGEKSVFVGRTEADAPEVDGVVYVSGSPVRAGEFCNVRITDAMEYDLVGEAA